MAIKPQQLIQRYLLQRFGGQRLVERRMRRTATIGGGQPLGGIALRLRARQEILGGERHARMPLQQVLAHSAGAVVCTKFLVSRQTIALLQVLQQLGDQHRRIARAVVLNGTADEADIQPLLSGQNRFQEQIAVIIATATVATFNLLRHQIEPQRRQRARIHAVVHAQQAHHLERNGTHRHQRTEVDLPGEEALTDAFLIEARRQIVTQNGQRHLVGIARRQAKIDGLLPLLFDQRQHDFSVTIRGEEGIQQLPAQRQPRLERARFAQDLPPVAELRQQVCQLPRQLGGQPARFVVR